jgi:diaminopimelate decarboxylase
MFLDLSIFPDTTKVNDKGNLAIGGCDTMELASEFGTPLYIFDETTLRNKCSEYHREFGKHYSNTLVIYACKAFLNRTLVLMLKGEGLGLDVVSGGEIYIADSANFPLDKVYFHGNNKSPSELEMALEKGVGHIVVDNFYELSLLNDAARQKGLVQNILLRLSPDIDPHTHRYITTGGIDSKFGFPIVTGQAEEAVAKAISASNLNLVGLHAHIGSLVFETDPYRETVKVVLEFASEMKKKYSFEPQELSIGGGFPVRYTSDAPITSVTKYAEAITSTLIAETERLGLTLPQLIVEPGRDIVAKAGVALYSVGAIKEIPKVRKYVSVDGGMADNIRPALYGSKYEAVVANRVLEDRKEKVTIAGKFCESGDILINDIYLPEVSPGDIIAMPACGAYSLPMASNYNASLKPTVVLVKNGKSRLIQRRETYEDLIKRDLL